MPAGGSRDSLQPPQDDLRTLQAGFQACILKPVDDQMLIRTVLALVEMKTLAKGDTPANPAAMLDLL